MMNTLTSVGLGGSTSNNTALTIKSSPPKTAKVACRLGVRVGTLTKRNESNQWQRRYCALVPQTLLYYFDTEYSESARGIIDLEYYTDVEIVAKNTIRLSTPPDIPLRSFFFRADTEDQCAAWAAALTRERYFVVADERDAYQKLQTEFQKESSATAEKVEKLRETISDRRTTVEASELRQHDALQALRSQALELGLSADAAASLRDAKDAVREVAHRLHYHMRRASHLEGAIEAVREERTLGAAALAVHAAPDASKDTHDDSGCDEASRVREIDELREKLSAVRRAREREATARVALESEKQALGAQLDELQRHVQTQAEARVKVEARAAELQEQKRLLVREVKTTRRAVAKVNAELDAPDDETHRVLALRRVGLDNNSDRLSSTSLDPGSDPDTASSDAANGCAKSAERLGDILSTGSDAPLSGDTHPPVRSASGSYSGGGPPPPASSKNIAEVPSPALPTPGSFALLCKACGGTVEGPQFSTCQCPEPLL